MGSVRLGLALLTASFIQAAPAAPPGPPPAIAPEIDVDAPVSGPAHVGRYAASLAFNGSVYLAVWVDYRHGTFGDIYGTRIAPDGTLLDPQGIPLGAVADYQYIPSVASDGTNFLVTWTDYSRGCFADILGARVSGAGVVLDPTPIPISTAIGAQQESSVAFDGTHYLVAWSDHRGTNYEIYAARVARDGTVLDPAGIAVSIAPNTQESVQVAYGGGMYLVTWEDARGSTWDIYGARVTPGGVVQDVNGILVSGAFDDQRTPAVAYDGTQFLVVWSDRRLGHFDTFGARVSTAGTVLDATGFSISTAQRAQRRPSVSFGGNFLVAWEDVRDGNPTHVYGARVTSGAVVLDPTAFLISPAASESYYTRVASDGTRFLVSWDQFDDHSLEGNSHFARVGADGTVLDVPARAVAPAETAANREVDADVAHGSEGFLMVWRDSRNGTWDIYAARATNDGIVLDPGGLLVSGAPYDQVSPSVASNGRDYLVVWQDYRSTTNYDVYAARVTAAGQVLDPGGVPVAATAADEISPSASFDGQSYLVTWTDENVRGARVAADGAMLDPAGFQISSALGSHTWSRAASSGTQSLVVWMFPQGGFWSIYGARVDRSGAVLDTTELPISTAARDQLYPVVTFDGASYVVAWQDARGGAWNEIYATRVALDGTVLNPSGIPLAVGGPNKRAPAVAYDGARTWVVWQDLQPDGGVDLHGMRLDSAGAALPPGDLSLSAEPYDESPPALATDGQGRVLLTYSRFNPAPSYATPRLRARVLSEVPLGSACKTTGECATGECYRGRCCDGRCARFTSTPQPQAACDEPFRYSPTGGPAVSGEGPFTFSVQGVDGGSPLPEGLEVDPATGEIRWTPTRAQSVPQRFELVATGAVSADVQEVSLQVTCPPLDTRVRCGCNGAPAPAIGALALMALALRRAGRRGGRPGRG